MGGIERRIQQLENLYHASGEAEDPGLEERRSEVIAELNRFEARIRSMSPEELKAWRESPEQIAAREALEAEIRRRRERVS